jgi:hypothetical protein
MSSHQDAKLSPSAARALQAFTEDARRLAKAHHALIEADRQFAISPPVHATHELQDALVEATNNYHRTLYGNVGMFVKYFRLAAPKSMTLGMPYASLERWLKWVAKNYPAAKLVEPIERSRRFRAEFVDHPQIDGRSWTWSTTAAEHPVWGFMTAIVYFSHRRETYTLFAPRDDQLDPFAPGWTPLGNTRRSWLPRITTRSRSLGTPWSTASSSGFGSTSCPRRCFESGLARSTRSKATSRRMRILRRGRNPLVALATCHPIKATPELQPACAMARTFGRIGEREVP